MKRKRYEKSKIENKQRFVNNFRKINTKYKQIKRFARAFTNFLSEDMQEMINYINQGSRNDMISLLDEPYITKEQLKLVNVNFEKVYNQYSEGKKDSEFRLSFNNQEYIKPFDKNLAVIKNNLITDWKNVKLDKNNNIIHDSNVKKDESNKLIVNTTTNSSEPVNLIRGILKKK